MRHLNPLILILILTTTVFTQSNPEQSSAEEAIKIAQAEVAANLGSAEAYYKLGQAYLAHYDSAADRAAEAFEQSIRLNPDYPEAYYKLALAYDKSNLRHFQGTHPKKEIEAMVKPNRKEIAEFLKMGLRVSAFDPSTVIQWADSIILLEDKPDNSIIEVSLSGAGGLDKTITSLNEIKGEV